jgi:hypothetical protein
MKNNKIILEDIQKLLVINSPQTTSLINEVVDELENILQEEFTAEERNLVRFYVKEQILDEGFVYNLKRRAKNFLKKGKIGVGRGRKPAPDKGPFIEKVFHFLTGKGFKSKKRYERDRDNAATAAYFKTAKGQETLRRAREKRAREKADAAGSAQLASPKPTEPTLPTNERELEQHFYSRARINGMGHSAATKAAREEMRRRESERIGNQQ